MTVLSRGARVRRGGRRPGWLLLTALLVLAIGASSALVFTNRAELLKLAVILALWAAVVAAFVSVIYRRQSDVDQARVRDLKLVYDLQLDREISARREYELTVESQLRRELASELRAQAADEVAALRAELTALRTNLEILFDAELDQRPALEAERGPARGYSDWDRQNESPRERVNRVASVRAEGTAARAEDTSIIDVPEVGVPPVDGGPLMPPPRQDGYSHQVREPFRGNEAFEAAQAYPGSHRRQHDRAGRDTHEQQPSPERWEPSEYEPAYQRHARHQYEAPAAPPERPFEPQPAGAEGQWLPPGTPGSSWAAGQPDNDAMTADPLSEPRLAAPPPAERRGRHSAAAEAAPDDQGEGRNGAGPDRVESRHSAEPEVQASRPEPAMAPPPQPEARHRSSHASAVADLPPGGQSVADLLARLQASPTGGGRRRRREE